MKFITLLGLAATALAMPYGELPWDDLICTPPEYICKPDFTGWLVCNVDGHYLDGGNCDGDTWCEYINDLPYCV
ncbi:uncharacterized protein GGS25DRAFT_516988 [Hypoxylon fragiforme]|uniref:uncharacterized protein n=1 Tax=Hypoxylon fragiforme TaxID=63214 RepID=UPI0020C61A0C|nr:uncharacterized protein GGS25DRAFT_516988 [Hypoxylon fragiforme]KAI2614134.1 hypothetical protein GGS25DRAFT_516988 [Hypoxylon fragiforme]